MRSHSLFRPSSPASLTQLVVVLLIVLALACIFYLYRATGYIRQALPQEVFEQQQAIFTVRQDVSLLLHAAERAQDAPSEEHVQQLLKHISSAREHLKTIRRNYSFTFLKGAAAMHAMVHPVLADCTRWLKNGFYQHAPDSQVVSQVVLLRLRELHQQVRGLFEQSNNTALQAVLAERTSMDQLYQGIIRVCAYLFLLVLVSYGFYWYLRQTVLSKMAFQRSLTDALEQSPTGIALFDRKQRLVLSNRRFRTLLELPKDDKKFTRQTIFQRGKELGLISSVNNHTDPEVIEQMLLKTHSDQDIEMALSDGRYIQMRERPYAGDGIISVFNDITYLKQTHALLERMATHDALTDLATRRLFQDRLERALSINRRHWQGLAVMFIDLDHFKAINDVYGHIFGDDFLQKAALSIRTCFRDTDTVARLGGDEFAVLVEGIDDIEKLADLAVRVLYKIRALPNEILPPQPGDSPSQRV